MALTHAERGRLGATATNTAQTAEQRSASASRAARARHSIDAYVAALVRRAPELTAGQVEQLRQVIASAPAGGASR